MLKALTICSKAKITALVYTGRTRPKVVCANSTLASGKNNGTEACKPATIQRYLQSGYSIKYKWVCTPFSVIPSIACLGCILAKTNIMETPTNTTPPLLPGQTTTGNKKVIAWYNKHRFEYVITPDVQVRA